MFFSFISYFILYVSLCPCLLCSYRRYTSYRRLLLWVYFRTSGDTLLVSAIRADDRANWLSSINPNARVIFLQIFPIWLLCRIFSLLSINKYQDHNIWSDKVFPSWLTFHRTCCSLTWSVILFSRLSLLQKIAWSWPFNRNTLQSSVYCLQCFSRACNRRHLKSLKSSITKFW